MTFDNLLKKIEAIVDVSEIDGGVILLSDYGPTHPVDIGNGQIMQVYDHQYFSPLGDALIDLYKSVQEMKEQDSRQRLLNFDAPHPL